MHLFLACNRRIANALDDDDNENHFIVIFLFPGLPLLTLKKLRYVEPGYYSDWWPPLAGLYHRCRKSSI